MLLWQEIIKKYERMEWDRWPELPTGGKSFKIEDGKYQAGRREEVLQDVLLLLDRKLITMKKDDWVEYMRDPALVRYRLEDMAGFYELAGLKPKWERLAEQKEKLLQVKRKIRSAWITAYLVEEEERLQRGKLVEENKLATRQKLYDCLVGLDRLEYHAGKSLEREVCSHLSDGETGTSPAVTIPMFQRVFSKKFLGNSKTFERELRSTVVSLARAYHPDIPKDKDAMDDVEVLGQLYVEIYSQELTLKGPLRFSWDGRWNRSYVPEAIATRKVLNTEDYPFGLVLSQQSLEHMVLCEEQSIRLIRTIENKANFVAEPYEEGKLVIFTHGYITPGERRFLVRLREVLERQGASVRYEHSGDLDFGGISIYRYMRKYVFPDLQPHRMDLATYEEALCQTMAEAIPEEMAEKIAGLSEDPQLGVLAARLAEDRLVVEQEAYL